MVGLRVEWSQGRTGDEELCDQFGIVGVFTICWLFLWRRVLFDGAPPKFTKSFKADACSFILPDILEMMFSFGIYD